MRLALWLAAAAIAVWGLHRLALSSRNPSDAVSLASAHLARARWALLGRRSPGSDLDAARKVLERLPPAFAAQAAPQHTWGELYTLDALRLAGEYRTPELALASAQSSLRRALQVNGNEAALHASVAEITLSRAWWRARRGESPKDDLEHGLTALSRALELNPRRARAEMIRAALHEVTARAATGAAATTEARRLRDEARARVLAPNPLLERETDAMLARLRP